ncbi:hypothetical protein MNBD_DELTA01-706 [hydrothermal vent metagenome]|uniref:DUF1330 domain-containing protein n=1 Tax=hydrothermal vent metagenome TaxID=652676 RepID=A0A3B0RHC4_9ZZZZ
MSYEIIVGLEVTDDKKYSAYREAIAPLLNRHSGGFSYDFKISEVLKNQEDRPINRVFLLRFEDKAGMDAFFSNPEYKKIKAELFENSVKAITIIAGYER